MFPDLGLYIPGFPQRLFFFFALHFFQHFLFRVDVGFHVSHVLLHLDFRLFIVLVMFFVSGTLVFMFFHLNLHVVKVVKKLAERGGQFKRGQAPQKGD